MGQRPKLNFLEYSQVAYQIEGNDACSNMIANILPVDHPPTLGVGSKGQTSFFSENGHVAYHIRGMTNAATFKHVLCPLTHPRPRGRGQRSKHFFSESSHVAYQIKENGT